MPSRAANSTLLVVAAASCLLDTGRSFVLVAPSASTSKYSNNREGGIDNSQTVPMGGGGIGLRPGVMLPQIDGLAVGNTVHLPSVPSAMDNAAQRRSRGSSCPPLHLGLLSDLLGDFEEVGQCGQATPPTAEASSAGDADEIVTTTGEEEGVGGQEDEEAAKVVVVVEEEEGMVEKEAGGEKAGLLAWVKKGVSRKTKTAATARGKGEVVEGKEEVVMEKKGLMAWVRKRRTTETSAAAAAAAAKDDASPALPEHEGAQSGQAPGEGVRKFGRLRAILERIVDPTKGMDLSDEERLQVFLGPP